ncbi:hypothetical protein [Paraburkholderia sp.]|uniref:hypothetical protein n=1 Tax=Paraburkholderia sp. TaxID=1926495 RepID=UPI0039E50DB6
MKLTPEQRLAYRTHCARLYRLHKRPSGAHVLVVKTERDERIGKLSLDGGAVTVETFDALNGPYRDAEHLRASVADTLNAAHRPGIALADAFTLPSEPETITSLPMIVAE